MAKREEEFERYLCASDLQNEGDWTLAAIKRFLGQPDKTRPNPYYQSGPPVRLYSVERVKEVEQSQEFKAWCEKSRKRRATARLVSKQQREKLIAWVDNLHIEVPHLRRKELIEKACANYNDHHSYQELQSGRDLDKYASPDMAESFILRICVNYLRHCLTPYEEQLSRMSGQSGAVAGHEHLFKRCCEAIAAAYPFLKEECSRQLERRDYVDLE